MGLFFCPRKKDKAIAASISDKATKSYSFLSKSLYAGISSVDTTIPLNNVTNIPTDTAVHFVIDRVDSNGNTTPSARELCKGVVSGGNLINCTRGLHGTTAQSHSSGAVVEFTASGVGWNELIDAFIGEHSQVDGTHSTTLVTARTEDTTPDGANDLVLTYDNSATALKKVKVDNLVRNNTQLNTGWITSYLPSVSSVTYNGNRSYTVAFGSSISSTLSPGMRLRATRTVTAPTQCADLEAGSSQYFNDTSVSGMTFTDDFVVSAWIKLESYTSASVIASRLNGTQGWAFQINSSGQAQLTGYNAALGNFSGVTSYQSIPLGKWVHVAAQLDMSAFTATTTTSYVMIDGLDVPAFVSRGGTNPTALVQAGDLQIGAYNGATSPFDGKIAQVAIYSAKVTQANVRATISQGLSGSETSLISAYSFNNSINDLNTSNANNLTAQGGALATNADSPFGVNSFGTAVGTYEYGIVTGLASSTDVYVQVPEGCAIPTSGGVSAVDLSTAEYPYGFRTPGDVVGSVLMQTNATTTTSVAVPGLQLAVFAQLGRDIRIRFTCFATYNTGANGGAGVAIYKGDTLGALTTIIGHSQYYETTVPASSSRAHMTEAIFTPTTTGWVYFTAQLIEIGGVGTATIEASATKPARLIAEVI